MKADIVCRKVRDEDELNQCYQIREAVFVEEQGLFKETDRDLNDEKSIHIAALYNGKIIGTVRVYEAEDGIWWGGRLAVIKKQRGKAGKTLIQKAVETVKQEKAEHFYAHVQTKNVPFFKSLKWVTRGDVFFCFEKPHWLMEADLGETGGEN